MPDYPALIAEKEEEESDLYKRMDADRDLLYLKEYKLKDPSGKEVPDIVNVTLNKPAVFAANVSSSLGAVSEQVIVESEDLSIDTTRIEEFQRAAFSAANYRLMRRALPLLNPFADMQFCFRGRCARRVLFRVENGELVPDIMPWDGRYLRYQVDRDGLQWAAYVTMRSKRDIEAEYGIVTKSKLGKVADVWDRDHNEVWVDGQKVIEQAHPWGFCPVVVGVVPLGYGNVLMDDNRVKYDGESIFFLVRDMVPQLNMLVSILQTLNLKLVKAPVQFANKEGVHAEPPEYEDATGSGAITSVDIGGGIKPVEYGDARAAAQMAYAMMEKAFQEGGYTDIDIGNVRQPFSAVALITVGESKDQVYMPRLAAKEQLNLQTAEMFTRQCLRIGHDFQLGVPGHQRTFKLADISGEYTTAYTYYVKSPKTDIARMAVAQVAERYYPREYLLSEVLHVEDVQGVMQAWQAGQAEMLSPNVKRHRVIMALLDKAEQGDENAAREAEIMALELGASLEMVKQGMLPEILAGGSKPPFAQLPMMGNGGQNAGGETPPLLGVSGQIGETPPTGINQSGLPMKGALNA